VRPSALLGRLIAPLESALMLLACAAIAAMVGITAVDVVFRYALNAPFSWSHDLTTHFLLIALFFFALPYVTGRGAHMNLDFAVRGISRPVLRNGFTLLGEVLGLLLAVGIAYGNGLAMRSAWNQGETLPGALPLPIWPMHAIVVAGTALLALRMLCGALAAVEATLDGRIATHSSLAD